MTDGNGRLVVFLDRDGVINRRRLDHVKSWYEFDFLPGSLEGLALLRRMEARVIVITNQAAVGRGQVRHEELIGIHQRMTQAISVAGGHVERIYACVHTPDANCTCRKPATDLFKQASAELGVGLAGSFMVGDSDSDVLAARAIGAHPVLIHGQGSNGHHPDCLVVGDLLEAVEVIGGVGASAGVRPC